MEIHKKQLEIDRNSMVSLFFEFGDIGRAQTQNALSGL